MIHEHGVAHRDLHPGNILYDAKADRLVITDFGLAAFCNGRHEFGGVGTSGALFSLVRYSLLCAQGFRAPEVVDAVASTVACDVFSAGVFLALLLRELAPSAFSAVEYVLGEEDLSAVDVSRLKHSLKRDEVLPATVKELLIAVLDPSPASRPSAQRVLSFAFLTTDLLPATSDTP